MKTATHFFARRLVMTLLAFLTTATAWAQLEGSGTENDPYLIQNESDWVTFTNYINKGVNATSYYKLTADLTLGTSEDPFETVVGNAKSKQFKGNFDGGFHTIHLYLKRKNDFAAPFGVTDGATIKNLTVDGTIISDHKFAGGFVGYANNTNNSTTSLIDCISRVNINCDSIQHYIDVNGNVVSSGTRPYDCTHGGLVGQNEAGYLKFENCAFEGTITDSKDEQTANKCTGFVGWVNKGVSYTNCIMAGTINVVANSDKLPNSMATYHRLASGVKPTYIGDNYFVTEYTYPGQATQGKQALAEIPENQIVKIYTVGRTEYYVPGVVVDGYSVTFCGNELVEGQDYLMNEVHTTTENKLIVKGINNYAGTCTTDIDPTYAKSVTRWDESTKTGWYAISSPVNTQEFSTTNFLTPTAKHNVYRYDEEKRMWQEYRNEANIYNTFDNGRGYIFRTEDESSYIGFNGSENKGDVDCKLTYTEKSDKLTGFNLIGNPYLHDIYMGVAIPNGKLADGYCTLTTQGTWEFKSNSEAITTASAIMVQVVEPLTKGECTITMIDTDQAPLSKRNNDEIWFTVKNSEYSDVAHVEFTEGRGFNKMPHYNQEAPMLYVKSNGENYASANLSDDVKVINLSFEAKKMGRYTLNFRANGKFNYLHLIDRMTGNDVDMLIEEDYSFISSSNDNADRFIVRLSYDGANETFENTSFAWQNGNEIIVEGQGQLQVFDVTGRMVTTTVINGQQTIDALSTGVYVFRMIGETIKTQKIVVK